MLCSQGRLDRKIEIPLPNELARMDILKIHTDPMRKQGDIGSLVCTQQQWRLGRWVIFSLVAQLTPTCSAWRAHPVLFAEHPMSQDLLFSVRPVFTTPSLSPPPHPPFPPEPGIRDYADVLVG